jgi:ABC-type lipoprotein export system ATPase subunit
MEILEYLHAQGSTIVMITHDVKNTSYAGQTLHLWDGKIDEEMNYLDAPVLVVAGGLT